MAVPRLAESQDRGRAVTSDLDPRLRASSHSPCHPPVSRGHRASDRPNPLTREDSVFVDAGYAMDLTGTASCLHSSRVPFRVSLLTALFENSRGSVEVWSRLAIPSSNIRSHWE